MATNHGAVEKVSLAVFKLISGLVEQFNEEDDKEALEALAPVLTTTGVISLCQTLGPESTIAVLQGLITKVEEGDFASLAAPGPDYRHTQQ